MKKIYTIGREEGCDIVIPDNTDVVSRLHATIRVESNDKIYLIDQSRNGTYVNGMKMSSNVEIPVTRKDVVSFAHIYNLDWSLVPAPKSNVFKNILIAVLCFVLIVGLLYAVIAHLDKTQEPEPEIETIETTTNPPAPNLPSVPEESEAPDSTPVADTEKVEKEQPKKEEKDTVKVKEPEEVYNPIY